MQRGKKERILQNQNLTQIQLSFKDGETVSKHIDGKISCSCKTWRISSAMQPVVAKCQHTRRAALKGIK